MKASPIGPTSAIVRTSRTSAIPISTSLPVVRTSAVGSTATGTATGAAREVAATGTDGHMVLRAVTTADSGVAVGAVTGTVDWDGTGDAPGMAAPLCGVSAPGPSVQSCTTRATPATRTPITTAGTLTPRITITRSRSP